MRFCVRHLTRYSYDRPVFLEPHTLRLRPREDATQRLAHFELEISPKPDGMNHGQDQDGNPVTWVWFSGLHTELTVVSHFEAQSLRENPFDYLPAPGAAAVPPLLTDVERAALAPYLYARSGLNDVAALGATLRQASTGVGDYLFRACAVVRERVDVTPRHEAGTQTPEQTLKQGAGACRDATVLFMELCRLAGIPARFVSGYQEAAPDQAEFDLHAWAEAYVPGGGWRGFDPSLGLAVGQEHLALCASADPAATAPIQGSVRGTGVVTTLSHDIWMAPPGDPGHE